MIKKKSLAVGGLAIMFGLISALSLYASDLRSFDEMYKLLPGQGRVDQSLEIDQALKTVIKLQELRENREIVIEGPKDVQIYNPRFLSISFNVSVKKRGSARAKPIPAVYALLFEKDEQDKLSFYKSTFLAWIGDQDVESYKKVTPEKMCEYFRAKGAEYVFLERKVEMVKQDNSVLNGSLIKAGIVGEQFIDSAITRDSELQAALGLYVRKDSAAPASTAKPVDDIRIQQLEARIKKLEALLANITRNGNNLVLNNMNLHIQNGTGSVSKVNGTGNLIVGYDDPGTGSHNILVGTKNTCNAYGSIVAGTGNVSTKKFSAIAGGVNNSATGDYAVILGGHDNKASGDYSSILGGSDNKAKGDYSSINGQIGRTKVGQGENKHFQAD